MEKNKNVPFVYNKIYEKLIGRMNESSLGNIDTHDVKYVLGSVFHIKKEDWKEVMREMESLGLLEMHLENKKFRVKLKLNYLGGQNE